MLRPDVLEDLHDDDADHRGAALRAASSGPSMPTIASRPLMPPLSWRRKPHTIVHATSETTTGEKKSVRKTVIAADRCG